MWFICAVLLSLFSSPVLGCPMANWWSSFDRKGFSTCGSSTQYINGLWRNTNGGKRDGIYRLEEARCCYRPRPYSNQPTQCQIADWVHSFDVNNHWSHCPQGFFLQGLYRSRGHWLHNIEYGKCCKPANHPYWWGHCYEENVRQSFDNKGTSKCRDGYFMTGLYRGSCDRLYSIEKFKCCKMYPNPPALQSLSDVKTRVMDVTMSDLALLAHYLGYGWCASCRAQYVGEDFRRSGDSWVADRKGPCHGYKNNHRLKMHYGDFKFAIKDIRYGRALIKHLKPENYISGRVTNSDTTSLTHKIEREIRSVRTVTHTTTSSWKHAHELGIEVSYNPPSVTGGVGAKASYKFTYEKSKTTTDSTSNQQYNSIKISSQKTLAPHTAVTYKIMLAKTRSTVAYTATVIAHFSAELDGFLRWGGGYNGRSTNFHYRHRGSGSRPTFRYRFGNGKKPFYTALKEQSDRNMHPWMWSNMKNRYGGAQGTINNLVNEGRYEFKLTGKFEDVIGQHADVQWKTESLKGRKRSIDDGKPDDYEELLESPREDNPPEVFPTPPKVTIDIGTYNETGHQQHVLGN